MPQRAALISVTVPPHELLKLERLGDVLRDIGAKDLQKELAAGLRKAAVPIRRELKRSALGNLPYRGGLADEVVAGMKFRTRVSVGKNPSLRIVASLPGHDLRSMNRGRIRHPVYGNRKVWANTDTKAGWWEDGGTLGGQDALEFISQAIDTVAKKAKARL